MALFTDISSNFRARNNDIIISQDEDAINNSIDNILRISKGEVPGRPEFGSLLEDYLFEPMDALTERLVDEVIREALEEFEPRITVNDIYFEDYQSENILRVTIEYFLALDKNKEIRSFTTTLNRL